MPKKILAFFERARAPFEPISHRVVYTAYDTAQTLGVKVTEVAKPLLVKADKRYALALLSAGHTLDLKKITKLLGVKKVRIPTEKEILTVLKLKKKEGLSSFGSLYALPTFLEKTFAKNTKGIFSTGSFTESVKMKLKDFVKIESPTIGIFGLVKKVKQVKQKKKTIRKPKNKK